MGLSKKWLVFLTVSLSAFLATLDISIVNISYPHLAKAFGVKPSVVLWVTVVYLLVSINLMLIVGRVGDVLGHKKIYVAGFSLFTLGLALCPLSHTVLQLILSRIVQGAGAAIIISLGNAILLSAFPASERGKALGLMAAVFSAGTLSGPAFGGFLIDWLDWRAIFYCRIPIAVIGTVMAWRFLEEQKGSKNTFRFDWLGSTALCVFLSCLYLFLNLGRHLGYLSPLVAILAGLAILSLILFIIQENRAAEPTVNLILFKNPLFVCSGISLALMFFAFGSYTFLLPFYLIDGLGQSASQTGLMIAVASCTTLLVAPGSGWLSDRIGSWLLSTVGISLICLSLFLLSRLTIASTVSHATFLLVVFGMGSGLFQSPNNSTIIAASPANQLGSTSAMMSTIRQLGMSIGITISGSSLVSYQADFAGKLTASGLSPAMIGKLSLISGFQSTLLIVSLVCCIGVATSLVKGPPKGHRLPLP